MATETLIARRVASIRPEPTETIHWDGRLKGFGLRVLPSGAKSWIILYRVPTRRWARKLTIGTYPKLSLAKARKRAKDDLAKAALGQDPAVAKQESRESVKHTVGALFQAYAEYSEVRYNPPGKPSEFRSWPRVRHSLEVDLLPEWRTRPVTEIRRRDVLELVTSKARSGATAANRLQAHISMLFSFGVEHDWLPANPAAGLRKRKEQPRDRVLKSDELRTLWRYLDGDKPILLARGRTPDTRVALPAGTEQTLRDLFKTLLLCGQRLGETSRMKWVDVDLDANRWTIPATETKNRQEHQVPLSKPVADLLAARNEVAHPLDEYVFPGSPNGRGLPDQGPRKRGSIDVWSYRTAAALARATELPFRAHDLRRTVATLMGELGIEADTIGLILNHRKPGVTTRHYDRSTRETAKRAALDRWAQRLLQIVTETPAKVTPIRARA